jgi:hypothetical protein
VRFICRKGLQQCSGHSVRRVEEIDDEGSGATRELAFHGNWIGSSMRLSVPVEAGTNGNARENLYSMPSSSWTKKPKTVALEPNESFGPRVLKEIVSARAGPAMRNPMRSQLSVFVDEAIEYTSDLNFQLRSP